MCLLLSYSVEHHSLQRYTHYTPNVSTSSASHSPEHVFNLMNQTDTQTFMKDRQGERERVREKEMGDKEGGEREGGERERTPWESSVIVFRLGVPG